MGRMLGILRAPVLIGAPVLSAGVGEDAIRSDCITKTASPVRSKQKTRFHPDAYIY